MTDLVVPPSPEVITIAWLKAQPEIAELTDSISSGTVPDGPCIRVTRPPGGQLVTDSVAWGDRARLVVACFGAANGVDPDEETAERLAQLARAAMCPELFARRHELGVVADCVTYGFGSLPDDSVQPARPRFQFDALVTVHP